ncbi:MAG: tRNA synthetase class and catalytic domain, partial [Actinomycetota bacterium]
MNALLCARLAKEISGELVLRVDDVDTQRQRTEYREAVTALVEWLDLPISAVHAHQNLDIDRYWMQLHNLAEAHP